jgi:hypothetical protein
MLTTVHGISARSTFVEAPLRFVPPRSVRSALLLLAEAHRLAEDTGSDPWDFAVDLDELSRAGASKGALRWLLAQGFALRAVELKPLPRGKRRFARTSYGNFDAHSCFVATDAGLALAGYDWDVHQSLSTVTDFHRSRPAPAPDDSRGVERRPVRPFYDAMRHELHFGGQLIKRFRCPAPNQQLILAAFQERAWIDRIDDPLPLSGDVCPQRRLNDTIRSLNRNQLYVALHFAGDGTGRGILWQPADEG